MNRSFENMLGALRSSAASPPDWNRPSNMVLEALFKAPNIRLPDQPTPLLSLDLLAAATDALHSEAVPCEEWELALGLALYIYAFYIIAYKHPYHPMVAWHGEVVLSCMWNWTHRRCLGYIADVAKVGRRCSKLCGDSFSTLFDYDTDRVKSLQGLIYILDDEALSLVN